MIMHGFVPHDMLLSTIIPIPKDKRKSLNDSDNYLGIALSSSLERMLDHIILDKHSEVLNTSNY